MITAKKQEILEYRRYTGLATCAGECKARHPHEDMIAATYQPPGGAPGLVLHHYACDRIEPLPDIKEIIADTTTAIREAREAGVDFDLSSIPGDDPMAVIRAIATGKASHSHGH